MNVVFRCESSTRAGNGHLNRCLALGHELFRLGWKCYLACIEDDLQDCGNRIQRIRLTGDFQNDSEKLRRTFANSNTILVVDHYEIDCEFEKAQRSWAKMIVVIDDLANRRHCADVLIDQGLSRNESDYFNLVPESCRVVTGGKFALLRPEFKACRGPTKSRWSNHDGQLRHVLVSMGATDVEDISSLVVKGLDRVEAGLEISILLGRNAPFAKKIENEISNRSNIHLYLGVQDITPFLQSADLVFGAGGVSMLERCCLGVPTALIETAKNQRPNIKHLVERKAIEYLGDVDEVSVEVITECFRRLRRTSGFLQGLSIRSAQLCDGRGAKRVAGLLRSADLELVE
jgi:UDP-2,4-diacetamido-2,4,6-trideoxy-beta-L-altropyranose hydrolase